MKLKNISLLALIWITLALSLVQAQDNRTEKTKVADVLTLLPAKNNSESDRLYRDLIGLNDEGLNMLTAQVLPNGREEGVAARYAVSLLTHHASSKQEKARIEKAYLAGLEQAGET